jgi:hypothetical protein
MKRAITRADLISLTEYEPQRKQRRAEMAALKRNRRLEVGPYCTFHFENHATMFHQVMEMLAIEKGGEAQVQDELDAYNPMIPQGAELIATVMFEIEDPDRRARELARLGRVEDTFTLAVGEASAPGKALNEKEERTREDGKTSSVHFIRFALSPAQIAALKTPGTRAVLGVAHPNYGHMAVIPEAMRAELAKDLE